MARVARGPLFQILESGHVSFFAKAWMTASGPYKGIALGGPLLLLFFSGGGTLSPYHPGAVFMRS